MNHKQIESKIGFKCECGEKFVKEDQLQIHIEENKKLPKKAEEPEVIEGNIEDGGVVSTEEVKVADKPQVAISTTSGPSGKISKYLDNEDVRKRIEKILDKRAGQFITSLMALVSANQTLQECTPQTFLSAAITAASLDLPVNPNLGFAYIIPYKDNRKGVTEAQFQMGYKGFIQLAQRSGQYKTIAATPVFEGQLSSENPLTGNTYDWNKKKSDKIIGYVAMFKLINGFEKELYMPIADVEKHGKRYSQAFRKGFGLWADDFDAMAVKTVLKLLISKFGPMSVDMQMAFERDQAVIEGEAVEHVDNIPEIEDKINSANSREEIDAIISTLSVDDRKKVVEVAEARIRELG